MSEFIVWSDAYKVNAGLLVQSGEADMTDELKKWLVDHIMVIDKKYSTFLNKKGVV